MPNIASVLKDEIARVARKELRSETERLKKAAAHYRSDIAALKRRVAALEQQVSRLEKKATKNAPTPTSTDAPTGVRFSSKGLASHRKRLGLSAAGLGRLLGVSPQTIYNWEAGSSKPREHQLPTIAALRGIGKREANARLAELAVQ